MNLKTFGLKLKQPTIKKLNPQIQICQSPNQSIIHSFIHNNHPNLPVNENGTKNQKTNHTKILQSFNRSILQSSNSSILQSSNLLILQSFFLFVFLFTLFSINYGQVKIKEKVEIKPGKNSVILKVLGKSSSTATIEVIANWTRKCGPEPVTATLKLWKEGANSNLATSSSTGSPVTVSTTVTEEANYNAQISFTNTQGQSNCADISMQFLVNGDIQGETETCNSCKSSGITRYVEMPACGDDAPECDGEPEAPEIIFNEFANLTFGFDICQNNHPGKDQLGGFAPVPGPHILEPITVYTCFDKDNNNWRFEVNNIEINTILDLCPDMLSNFKVIDNVNEVDSNDICEALEDFDNHKSYPLDVRQGGYLLRPVLLKHEEMHKKLFEDYMKKNKDKLEQKILNYKPSCDEFSSYSEAQEGGTNKAGEIVKQHLTENYNLWRWQTGKDKSNPDYKKLYDQNEQHTHAKVELLIIQYKMELMRLYGSWVWCI